ncbi:proline-rich domain-containing protein [Pseudonocardia sp.]|uniref:proline-rich domain-containing protein n=1 Tax=Pseudonocardia sp. TaxID=60912 RepID=UPI002623F835|nr:proline-rich domain-containing protein [Pseudonocardia sp.]
MTTPPDPQQGQPPPGQQPPPYGTGYGGVQYPNPAGPGGQQPGAPYGTGYGGAQYPNAAPDPGGAPYGQPPAGGYPYNPYSPYGSPAGLGGKDTAPAERPTIMILGLVLKILAALPFLAFGVLFLLAPLDANTLPAEVLDNPQLADAGITTETVVGIVRVAGGIFVVLALLYIVFAVLAFTGRNWARIVVTVMTVGFTAFLLLGLTGGVSASDVTGLVVLLALILLPVAGVVILYLPASNAYFSAIRR